jgi:hypothetical protein
LRTHDGVARCAQYSEPAHHGPSAWRPPKHQAPALPLAIVAALEVTVCDAAAGQYTRGFAFYKLLKLWAAGRHSDFEGLNPSSLFLSVAGLEGRLDRTKTSGPGRRVRFLPFS